MTKCPGSFLYFDVRKCALSLPSQRQALKGAECLKPAQKALFVQNLVATSGMHLQLNYKDRAPLSKSAREVCFPF